MSESKPIQEEAEIYTIKHKGIIYYQGPYNTAAKLLSQSLNLSLEKSPVARPAENAPASE